MAETPDLHILVIAPGARPRETLARALSALGSDGRAPHEVHVIASQTRLEAVRRDFLLGGATGRFAALCAAAGFARDEILFNHRTLHSLDVDSTPDCNGGASRVLDLLRSVASSSRTSVTVVVAEDAGAAGHLLHACLQIVGRVSDRLLLDVSTGRPARGRTRDTSGASSHQIEIPLLLWPADEPQPSTYAEAVERRRTERRRVAQPEPLRLDVRRRLVSVGETTMTLPAMQFFWLYYLASTPGERFPLAELSSLASGGKHPAHFTQKLRDGRVRVFPADLQRAFAQIFPMGTDKFEAMFRRSCGVHPGLPSTISKINAALRRALGRGAGPYLIQGGRGAGGYRLTVPAVQIVGAEHKRA